MTRLLDYVATTRWSIPRDAEMHPLNQSVLIEKEFGKANARKGLKMAINDVVEETADLGVAETARIDIELASLGAMTLSEARARFSKKLQRVLKRGEARNEEQYYLLKNAEDFLLGEDADRCRYILANFETVAGKGEQA